MEKRFALIGHPVAQSLSPVLFRAAYGGRYPYDLVDEADFDTAMERVRTYAGFNVTAPYKMRVPRYDPDRIRISDRGALATGCVNTVVRKERKGAWWYEAYNTDIDGVTGALAEAGVSCSGARALVVGSGGAAMAAFAALSDIPECAPVMVARNPSSILAALNAGNGAFSESEWMLLDDLKGPSSCPPADVIVYTLPASAPVPEGLPWEQAVVLEAEYKQPRLAHIPCRRYISGRRWLYHQAVTAYRLFTGEEPDLGAMQQALP